MKMKMNSKQGRCYDCVKLKKMNYYIDNNALPIWIDEAGVIQYDVPDCLSSLTIGEKMLIQLASPFIPLKHMKNGVMGMTGHVCAFEQDINEFSGKLPNLPDEVTVLQIHKVVQNEIGGKDGRDEHFLVRKEAVHRALQWLKKYNVEYKHVEIDMGNMDWMNGDTDFLVGKGLKTQDDIITAKEATIPKKNDLGPNPRLTRMMAPEEVSFVGFRDESKGINMTTKDAEILQGVRDSVAKSPKKKSVTLQYPKVSANPISEFGDTKIFVRAFPWLFPGGVGDVKHYPDSPKKWGQHMLMYQDGRFATDKMFSFYASNYVTRHRNTSGGNWFIKDFNNGGPTNLKDLQEEIMQGDTKFVNRLTYFAKSVKGSSPFWFQKRSELYTWINHHVESGNGAPMFFITLSCAEYFWPDVIRLIKERMELGGHSSEHCYVGSPKLSSILNDYSIVVQQYFQERVKIWLTTVGKTIFDIEHYWVRYEFAPGRGQIHAHLLAITKDQTIQQLCHEDLKLKHGKVHRDQRLARWAKEKFGLTASVDEKFDSRQKPASESPCSVRFTNIADEDMEDDEMDLMNFCQVHKCNGFCLRSKGNNQ